MRLVPLIRDFIPSLNWLLVLCCLGLMPGVSAATATWDGGGADDNWTTAENWVGDVAPVAGDDLHFAGTIRLTPTNDFAADTGFASITFIAGAGAFTIGGNRIALLGAITNGDDSVQTLALDLVLGATRTCDAASGDLVLSGSLSGIGGLAKSGTGVLTLSGAGANTYTGLTTVTAGRLHLSKTAGVDAIAENLSIAGGMVSFGANHQIADTGAVTMSGTASIFNGTGLDSGQLDNQVETISSLTMTGGAFNTGATATWTITGAWSCTGGAGNSTVIGNGGTLVVVGSLALSAMTATAGGTVATANSFTWYGNGSSRQSTLTVGAGGLSLDGSVLNLRRGGAGTLGSKLVLDGTITTSGSAASSIIEDSAGGTNGAIALELSSTASAVTRTITTTGGGADLAIGIPITDGAATPGSLTKSGAGSLTLTGINTYTGDTTISAGTLRIGDGITDGSITASASIIDQAALVFDLAGSHSYNAAITGAGSLTKAGTGILTLVGTNTYSGATIVTGGTLRVTGSTAADSAVTVQSGAKLGGTGTVAGTVSVAAGGTLDPGIGNPLVASFVASSLRGVTQDDWRLTQTITGTRVDQTIAQPGSAFGTAIERLNYGIGGTDTNWDAFSVQWDGFLTVLTAGTALSTRSDDSSRVWLDLNNNGVVDVGEWGSNGWGNGQSAITRTVHASLAVGTYRMRVQYEEGNGGNAMSLLWDDAANSAGTESGLYIVPATLLGPTIGTLTTGAVTFDGAAAYVIDLDGATPTFDQVNTAAAVTCAGTLTVATITNPALGRVYTIINAGSVSGTFSGLADGSMFLQQGRTFRIAYTGTQVTLTDVARPTLIWDGGGTDDNWSTAANWDNDLAPTAGDNLQFAGTTRPTPNNDTTPGTNFASITFAPGAGAFTLSGSRVTLSGPLTNAGAATQTIALDIGLAAIRTADAASGDLIIGGVISGAGGLTKTGAGTLTLTATNTYAGITTISAGTLRLGDGVNDGSIANSVGITNNAALHFDLIGTNHYPHVISGTGMVTKTGAGMLTLTANHTYTGATTVNAGTLLMNGSTAAASAVNMNTGTMLRGGGTVAGPVTVADGATLAPGGTSLVASFVASSLRAVTQDDWRLTQTITGTRVDPTIAYPGNAFGTATERQDYGIGGSDTNWNGFSVQWDGFLTVVTANTTLSTRSDDGSRVWLDLNHNGVVDVGEWGSNGWGNGQAVITRTVHSNLAVGTYRMRAQYEDGGGDKAMYLLWDDAANSGGTVSGLHIVPATLLEQTIDTLTTGAVTFNASSTYAVELDGRTPSFDQVSTSAAVTCAGTLTVGSLDNSTLGAVYTIVDAGSVSGTFSGLADGSLITMGDRSLQIAYTATQVTLTEVPHPTLRVWDGGGIDDNWTTAANWADDTAPVAGNDLRFAGTTRLTPNNDFAADTSFASITFLAGAGAFTLGGNRVALAGAITNDDDTTQTIALDLGLAATRTCDAASGDLTIAGILSGTGGLTKTGTGVLTLSGATANTYAGLTSVTAGRLHLAKTAGVDAIAGNLSIVGGQVSFGANHQIADTCAVTMSGTTSVFNGTAANAGMLDDAIETIASLSMSGGAFNTGYGSLWTVAGAMVCTGGAGDTIVVGNSGSELSVGSLSLSGMGTVAGNTTETPNTFTLYGNRTLRQTALRIGSGGLSLDGSILTLRRGADVGVLGSKIVLDGDISASGGVAEIYEFVDGTPIGGIALELSSTAGAATRTITVANGTTFRIYPPITNGAATPGAVTIPGTGTLSLNGTLANTFSGLTTLTAGRLYLNKTAGVDAIAGDLSIAGGQVSFGASHQIADTCAVTMSGSSSVLNGTGVNAGQMSGSHFETIASLTMNGGTFNGGIDAIWTITGAWACTGGAGDTLFVGNSGTRIRADSLALSAMTATAGGTVGTANSFTLYGNDSSRQSTLTVGAGGIALNGSVLNLRRGDGGSRRGSRLVLNGPITTSGGTASSIIEDTNGGANGGIAVELSSTAGAETRTITVSSGSAALTIGVPITNGAATPGAVTKSGVGALTLTGALANTYSGVTTVDGGTLILQKTEGVNAIAGDLAIGNASGSDVVRLRASHQIADTAVITFTSGGGGNSAKLELNGYLETVAGLNSNAIQASVIQDTESGAPAGPHSPAILTVANATDYVFDGIIRNGGGQFGLAKSGTGTLTLRSELGPTSTAYTGATTVSAGRLVIDNFQAFSSPIAVTSGAADALTFHQSTRNLNLGVVISGTGASTKTGTGVLTLSGANTNTGATTVAAGTLLVTGSTAAGSTVTVDSGSTLGGTGTIAGAVTVADGGNLTPGTGGTTIATLTLGSLTTNATSVTSVDLNGTTPTFDQLAASGAVACAGTLTVASIANAALGKEYVIVTADSVSGTFDGLADDTLFVQQGRMFRIAYEPTTVTLRDSASVVVSRETLDTDGNGQIDRIRLTFDAPLNDDVSGLAVAVTGYVVTGFATGTANDTVIDVLVTESGSPDTSATPTARITANSSLAHTSGAGLVQAEGSATATTDSAAPVLLSSLWTDGDANGVDANDTLVLTFSETVASSGMVFGDLGLPVTGDTLGGNAATVIADQSGSTTITITLATGAALTPGGTYAATALGDAEPSGIFLTSNAHLTDEATVANSATTGNAASAADIGASPSTFIRIQWNDTNDIIAKDWAVGAVDLGSATASSVYTILNAGSSSVALAATCSDSATWTVESAAGVDRFAMAADADADPDFEVPLSTVAAPLASVLRSGSPADFSLRFSAPSTTSTGAAQSITVTITASQY